MENRRRRQEESDLTKALAAEMWKRQEVITGAQGTASTKGSGGRAWRERDTAVSQETQSRCSRLAIA